MNAVLYLGYFLLGILQFIAVFSGVEEWLGWHWLIITPISLAVAYMPIVGTIAGIWGAKYALGWSWFSSLALFVGPFAVLAVAGLLLSRR